MSTPPYYPPGWNKDRWQSGTEAEYSALTAEQLETFHTGLRADLGEDGVKAFFAEMDRRQIEVTGSAPGASSLSNRPPNFLLTLHRAFGDNEEWGFVVFWAASMEDSGAVDRAKERVAEEMHAQMRGDGDVANARERFRFMWVDGPDLEGANAAEIARRYREMEKPIGLEHSLCLCVDDASFKSIQLGSSGIAHMLAVSQGTGLEQYGDEAEDKRWDGTFKVAIGSLITELFPVIGNGSLSPFELGVGVTQNLVWTGITRFGRIEASVV